MTVPSDRFDYTDYKQQIRDALKRKRVRTPACTFAYLAEKIGVQASYLSRLMNSPDGHISEDHLYRIYKLLDCSAEEIEFGFLLRAAQTTALPQRRAELQARIEKRNLSQGLHVIPALRDEIELLLHALDRMNASVRGAK